MKPKAQNQKSKDAQLPPHSDEAERGVLACVLQLAERDPVNWAEVDSLLLALRPVMFYSPGNAALCFELHKLRSSDPPHCFDTPLLIQWLTDRKRLEDCGGLAAIADLPNQSAGPSFFHAHLSVLKDKWHRRRAIQAGARILDLANDTEVSHAAIQQEFDELAERSRTLNVDERAPLKVWRVSELLAYVPPPHLALVGSNELKMGYEGVCVVAGPGSSGKSLCVASLALGGAIGHGLWMGRTIHRRFRTLIIQAENGTSRLKAEVEAFIKNHPEHAKEIGESIFFTDPPEGGLPFHHADFRSAVRRAVNELKVDLVVVDPWSQVATEDAAKEVVDKLNEIRSCFPSGDQCPGLLVIAHTKKPRAEDVRKGRGLAYLVSGSIALPNTARCVYVLLPWTDDLTDDRIYWSCCKLNDGEMYAPTVWRRRFGTFFEHDDKTDPCDWQKEDVDDRQKITVENLQDAFDGKDILSKADLVKRLSALSGAAENTCYRALDEGNGYLARYICRDQTTRKMKLLRLE